ncbi:MAG: carboxypeptidase regulatory-like domain-containing protein [Deltaproteobacteria bacterium]|nr:carboxypeptidase regulatory-like domain-containing protein [Deltaproteobacteria bacterium]
MALGAVLLCAAGAATAAPSYQAGEIQNAGAIVGEVTYDGPPPPPRTLAVTKDQEVCGQGAPSESLVVGRDGKVANAVVSIVGITRGKPMPTLEPVLDQKGCRYLPHVLLAPAGETIRVRNSDGILHNVHTRSRVNPPVNIAQPKFKKEVSIELEEPESVAVRCDAHEWMSAVIVAMEHPYYAASDPQGTFRIGDVPPGEYTLRVWHETLGEKSEKVTIEAGKETRAVFELGPR